MAAAGCLWLRDMSLWLARMALPLYLTVLEGGGKARGKNICLFPTLVP